VQDIKMGIITPADASTAVYHQGTALWKMCLPEPKKIYFYHENMKVRKHKKENLILQQLPRRRV